MPLPAGTHYAMKKTSKGTVRLAYNKAGKVIEAKNMSTGKTHTPAEFKADAAKKKKKPMKKRPKND
jgi:hypothetical protein